MIAHQRVLESRLSGFALELPQRRFLLGEWVLLTLRFRLKRPVDIQRLTITLQGTEKWSTGSGNSRSTRFRVPDGAAVAAARGTTGRWILLSTLGLALAGTGVAMWIDVAHSSFLALAVAGLAMLVVGIWRFVGVVR